jgi:hypothetical protein
MDVIVYTTIPDEDGRRLESVLETVAPRENIEVYRTIHALSERLRRPVDQETVAVLAPASRWDLMGIIAVRQLLHDIRTIIIAPDQESETVAKAHQLRPRFLTYVSGDFEGLAAVLRKMATGTS